MDISQKIPIEILRYLLCSFTDGLCICNIYNKTFFYMALLPGVAYIKNIMLTCPLWIFYGFTVQV